MNALLSKVAPSAANMIRMDHTHVLETFHQYDIGASPRTRQALVNTICLALEIHAQLEEEIFYPAMRAADGQVIDKSVHEHDEMRRLIAQLRGADPTADEYDSTVLELMRDVMHHVADEETILLPDAERLLGFDRLSELGAEMTRRRFQLSAPHAGEMALNTVRAMPASTVLVAAGALIGGAYLVNHAMKHHTSSR